MLAGPEPNRLAGEGEQERRPKRGQVQMRGQSVVSQCCANDTIRQANQLGVNTFCDRVLAVVRQVSSEACQRTGRTRAARFPKQFVDRVTRWLALFPNQRGHGPIVASTPSVSLTGPSRAVVSATVSLTVTLNVRP